MLQILGMGAHLTRAHLHPYAGNHQLGLQWMATLEVHRQLLSHEYPFVHKKTVAAKSENI
jgi:hypothetical protein